MLVLVLPVSPTSYFFLPLYLSVSASLCIVKYPLCSLSLLLEFLCVSASYTYLFILPFCLLLCVRISPFFFIRLFRLFVSSVHIYKVIRVGCRESTENFNLEFLAQTVCIRFMLVHRIITRGGGQLMRNWRKDRERDRGAGASEGMTSRGLLLSGE